MAKETHGDQSLMAEKETSLNIDLKQLSPDQLEDLIRRAEAEKLARLAELSEIPLSLREALERLPPQRRWETVLAGGTLALGRQENPRDDEFAPFCPLRVIRNFPLDPSYAFSRFPERVLNLPNQLSTEDHALAEAWADWLESRGALPKPMVLVDPTINQEDEKLFLAAVAEVEEDIFYKAVKPALLGIRFTDEGPYLRLFRWSRESLTRDGLESFVKEEQKVLVETMRIHQRAGAMPLMDRPMVDAIVDMMRGDRKAYLPASTAGIAACARGGFVEACADIKGGLGFLLGQQVPLNPYTYPNLRGPREPLYLLDKQIPLSPMDGKIGEGIEVAYFGRYVPINQKEIVEHFKHELGEIVFRGLPPELVRPYLKPPRICLWSPPLSYESVAHEFADCYATGHGKTRIRQLVEEARGVISS